MKSPPWILNFLIIICLKVKIIAAFSMMNNVIINYEGLNIQFENAFKRGYGKDLLAIGNLKLDRVENMKPHLTAIVDTLPDNPLRTYFEYSRALCIDYPAIHKLNAITQNIYNFVAASKGITINSFMSIGGVRIVNNSIVSMGDAKLFIATSVRTDTENEIKSYFDKHEEAMRKAAEIREQALARAKRIREQIAREREAERLAREALLRQERYAREAKRQEEKLRKDREKLQRKLARDAEKREEDQKKAAAKREEEQRKAAAKRDEEQRKAAAKREKAPGRGPTIQQTPNAAQRQLQKNNSNNGYRLVNSKTVSKRMVVEEDDNDDDDDDDDDEDNDEDDDDNDDEDMF